MISVVAFASNPSSERIRATVHEESTFVLFTSVNPHVSLAFSSRAGEVFESSCHTETLVKSLIDDLYEVAIVSVFDQLSHSPKL